jgi:hemoglobin-like flavoprotein
MHPHDLIRENLDLVASRAPDLTARFYERLFARHPEVRHMFGRRSAEAQQRMLLEAIVAVVDHLEDAAWLAETLGAMGEKHVDYGVEDAMYPLVVDALVATLEAVSAEAWSPELEAAWRAALGFVAETMIAGAERARQLAAE